MRTTLNAGALRAAPAPPIGRSGQPQGGGALGQVFTPAALVEFILNQAGYLPSVELLHQALLEPACGEGAFLVAAARRLAEVIDPQINRLSMRARSERLTAVLLKNLWGVDIDSKAVSAARAALCNFVRRRTGIAPAKNVFRKNIICADFLEDKSVLRLPPIAQGSLHFVIGNPPYVSTTALTSSHKDRLRACFATAQGRIDLYGLFIERSIQLLRNGGALSFIVPDKFLHSLTAQPLRAFMLENGSVRSIASFESHKVFEAAATVPCIFVLDKARKAKGEFRALECEYRNGAEPAHIAVDRDEHLPLSRLQMGVWKTRGATLEAVADAISAENPTLKDRSIRVSAGLATGRDSIYVVPREVAAQLDPQLLHRAVRGRDIGAMSIEDPGLSILLPFEFTSSGPALIDIRKYAKTEHYLKKFKRELRARHCVKTWDKAWFEIHDPVSADLTRLPKVLVPDVAAAPRFAFDDGQRCPLHSAYYIVPKGVDGRVLAAILNSRPIEFLIRLRAPIVKDGFNRYRRQFLIDLPIPNMTEDAATTLVYAAESRDFKQLDELAASAFQLSAAHRSVIDRHLERVSYGRSSKGRTQ